MYELRKTIDKGISEINTQVSESLFKKTLIQKRHYYILYEDPVSIIGLYSKSLFQTCKSRKSGIFPPNLFLKEHGSN